MLVDPAHEDRNLRAPAALREASDDLYGQDVTVLLEQSAHLRKGSHVFAYKVKDPERYGVVEFTKDFKAISADDGRFVIFQEYDIFGVVEQRIRVRRQVMASRRAARTSR